MSTKNIAILLVFVWLLQSFSPFVVFSMGKWVVKMQNCTLTNNEVKHRKLEIIHFNSVKEIEWEMKGKELIKEGRIYDVVALSYKATGIDITCFEDSKENQLTQLIAQQNNDDQADNFYLKQVFKNKVIVDTDLSIYTVYSIKKVVNNLFTTALLEPVIHVHIPPPKALFT